MHFKQFGLRSGLTFCPVYFLSASKLYLKLSSAFNLCKHDTSVHRCNIIDQLTTVTLSTEDSLLKRNMIHRFVALINREQPAEMKHDKQVSKSIYRGQSAEYSVIHQFPSISIESNLLRINMRNRFTTRPTKGSLLRLNII